MSWNISFIWRCKALFGIDKDMSRNQKWETEIHFEADSLADMFDFYSCLFLQAEFFYLLHIKLKKATLAAQMF